MDLGRVRLHRPALGAGRPARSGLGAGLLAAAEAEILRRGCDRVALNTHSFQAPGFYARSGYTECGRTPGYPHGHDDIHLLKLLGRPGHGGGVTRMASPLR